MKSTPDAKEISKNPTQLAFKIPGLRGKVIRRPAPKNKQSGQSLVEYLVIVAIVGVGAISIMRMVGQSVKVQFAHVAMALGAKVDGGSSIEDLKINKSSYQKSDLTNFWHSSLDKGGGDSQDSGGSTVGPIGGL